MNLLIDTKVLVRLEDSIDPRHAEAMSAVEKLKSDGHECQLVPQVLYEFWVVATRPVENNGLGLDPAKCEDAVRGWMTFFRLRLDERGIFRNWINLVAVNHGARQSGTRCKAGCGNAASRTHESHDLQSRRFCPIRIDPCLHSWGRRFRESPPLTISTVWTLRAVHRRDRNSSR